MAYMLDTNIITALLKGNENVKQRILTIRLSGKKIAINALTYYETKRGLLRTNAASKLIAFNLWCEKLGILLPDRLSVFDIASEIWADLQRQGKPLDDADILIASMAKAWEMILVSDDKHFNRIQGLMLENWLKEEQ